MKHEYRAVVKAAMNALYSRDEEQMVEVLHEVLEVLDPELAELFHDDEEAAMAKVNGEELNEDDDEDDLDLEDLF